jgi:hypothetical protein
VFGQSKVGGYSLELVAYLWRMCFFVLFCFFVFLRLWGLDLMRFWESNFYLFKVFMMLGRRVLSFG